MVLIIPLVANCMGGQEPPEGGCEQHLISREDQMSIAATLGQMPPDPSNTTWAMQLESVAEFYSQTISRKQTQPLL